MSPSLFDQKSQQEGPERPWWTACDGDLYRQFDGLNCFSWVYRQGEWHRFYADLNDEYEGE